MASTGPREGLAGWPKRRERRPGGRAADDRGRSGARRRARRIVSAARGRFGTIDILVNNAGVGQATIRTDNRQNPIKFWEVTPEQWRLFVAVHTNAPMALSRAVVHDMMRQRWGRIVNVTTSLGTMIREGLADLRPVKGGARSVFGDHGQGSRRHRRHGQRAGAGRRDQYRHDPGGSALCAREMIQPEVMAPPLVWLVRMPPPA